MMYIIAFYMLVGRLYQFACWLGGCRGLHGVVVDLLEFASL